MKYFKTVFLSLSLCFIFNTAFSNKKFQTSIVPDTMVLGTVTGDFASFGGNVGISFDQNRYMPPGDQMYVTYGINDFFCSSNNRVGRFNPSSMGGGYPVNWYNDSVAHAWTNSSNGFIHSSGEINANGCHASNISFTIVYVSNTGNHTAYVTINNFSFHLGATHIYPVTATYNGNLCNPVNVDFFISGFCSQCQGSSSSEDVKNIIDFGDGRDTFFIKIPFSFYFGYTISHTYDSIGSFNPTFHVGNGYGGGDDTLSITVNPKPPAAITASSSSFCDGDNVILNAIVQPDYSYQWKKGGVDIPGATVPSYTAFVGGNYRVTVTNTLTGCSKTTPAATLLIRNPLPVATITPQGPTTFCAGGNVVLKANSGVGLIYKWKKDGTYISGANGINYTAFDAGKYKVQVINSNGCKKTSPGVVVTIPCREGGEMNEKNSNVLIFPNPTSGKFTIQSDKKISQLTITNLSGQIIIKKDFFDNLNSSAKINLNKEAKGIYLIQVITDSEVINQKIILN